MPRGGHNRKSAQLRLIQGTLRADRAGRDAPKPRPLVPAMPKGLDRLARKAWRQSAPILQRLGLLTELDVPAFTVLCLTWARLERARRRLADVTRRVKAIYKVEQVEAIRKCEVSVEKAEHSWRQLAAEFGMTPASRNRLDIVAPPIGGLSEEEEFAEEFFGERPRGPE